MSNTTIIANQQRTMSTLFAEYVARRNSGSTMDEVVQALQEAAYLLPREERHQLGKMVQEWEAKNTAAPTPVQEAPTPPSEQPPQRLTRLPSIAPLEAPQA